MPPDDSASFHSPKECKPRAQFGPHQLQLADENESRRAGKVPEFVHSVISSATRTRRRGRSSGPSRLRCGASSRVGRRSTRARGPPGAPWCADATAAGQGARERDPRFVDHKRESGELAHERVRPRRRLVRHHPFEFVHRWSRRRRGAVHRPRAAHAATPCQARPVALARISRAGVSLLTATQLVPLLVVLAPPSFDATA